MVQIYLTIPLGNYNNSIAGTGREIIIKALGVEEGARVADAIAAQGYVCVPRVPTDKMLDEAWAWAHDEDALGVWNAMIGAYISNGNSVNGSG